MFENIAGLLLRGESNLLEFQSLLGPPANAQRNIIYLIGSIQLIDLGIELCLALGIFHHPLFASLPLFVFGIVPRRCEMSSHYYRVVFWFSIIVCLISAFNNCGGIKGFNGQFSAASSCKNKPGLVSKLNGPLAQKQSLWAANTSTFGSKKIQLRKNVAAATAAAFSPQARPLERGETILLTIDTQCALNESQGQWLLSSWVAPTALNPDLRIQAVRVIVPESLSESQLFERSQEDHCLLGVSDNLVYKTQAQSRALSNDPYVANQRHMSALHSDEAWARLLHPTLGILATNLRVPIAIIDTGMDGQHEDLKDNLHPIRIKDQTFYGVDATTLGTGTIDYNAFDEDPQGHGTHVAGLAAATANNSKGGSGVAPLGVSLIPVKVFKLVSFADGSESLETTSEFVANGVRWATDRGAKVINLSISRVETDGSLDPAYESALEYALAAGVFIVAAAGNQMLNGASDIGQEITFPSFTILPAYYSQRYQGMVAVGSVEVDSFEKSPFSHYSNKILELGAYGNQVNEGGTAKGLLSTVPISSGNRSGYGVKSGTSMAAPLVSAAAALIISWIQSHYELWPTPAEVERLLTEGSLSWASLRPYFKDGKLLDLKSLVSFVEVQYPRLAGKPDLRFDQAPRCY